MKKEEMAEKVCPYLEPKWLCVGTDTIPIYPHCLTDRCICFYRVQEEHYCIRWKE